ncbi:hypothetical protein Emag_005639 [Eimeria magna]
MSSADPEQPPDSPQGKRHWTLRNHGSDAFGHAWLEARDAMSQQLLQETTNYGICYSLSQTELLIEVMKPQQAWSQLHLLNTGVGAISFLLKEHVQQPKGISRHHEVSGNFPSQTLGVTNMANMNDPEVREKLFAEKNEMLGLTAPSPLVDEFLLLRQQAETSQPSKQCYQLEILHRKFQPLQLDLQRSAEAAMRDNASAQRLRANADPYDAHFASTRDGLSSRTASDEGGGLCLEAALAAAAADVSSFSVQALHRRLLVFPRPLQRREYLRAMQCLIYQCDDWQPHSFLQNQQGGLQTQDVAADSILHSALSEAIETFLSALPEALDLSGLSNSEAGLAGTSAAARTNSYPVSYTKVYHTTPLPSKQKVRETGSCLLTESLSFILPISVCGADEKGRQATRGSKRQYTKVKRESKVCEEFGLSAFGGPASAALAAAMASVSEANNTTGGEGDAQTRHRVAEQLLYWLLKETVAAKESDLAMSAATRTASFGSAIAQAARQQQLHQEKSIFSHLSREAWLPSPVDLRVNYMMEYLSRKQLHHVTAWLPPEQAQRLQLQGTTLTQLFQEILGSKDRQEQLLPVACLHTAEEIAFFIDDTAQKKGLVLLDHDAFPAAMTSKGSADFEFYPYLFIVPSWPVFLTLATQTLTTRLQQVPLTKSSTAVRQIRYIAKNVKPGEEATYLAARRHMMELAALLDIDLLLLDSFDSLTKENLRGAPPVAEGDLTTGFGGAATAYAPVGASHPWLLGLPAKRALGPHVTSYLLVACLLMGIDAAALQERATQLRLDWQEETRKKESLDTAADAVCRRIRKEFRQLLTDCRSCCLYRVPAESGLTADAVGVDDDVALLRNSSDLRTGLVQQMHGKKFAILCSYWDLAFSEPCASGAAATAKPLLQWAALQFQHLKAVVSGTVISDVLLAGDLISLICGFAFNGHVALESSGEQDENPRQQEVLDNSNSAAKANAWAAAAAIDARDAAPAGHRKGIIRAWLRIPVDPSEEVCCNSISTTTICTIQPRVCGVRQLREFLQQQLLAVLDLESANESPAANEPNCLRQTSEGCASSQRSGSKLGKGLTKTAAADGSVDGAATSEASIIRTAEGKKERHQPMLVICHLPKAGLLWNVLRDTQTRACVPVTSQVETPTHARRSSQDGHAASRPYGSYASLPITAIKDVVASVGISKLLLWLGEELSRPTHTVQRLIKAGGFLDATRAMTQSLFNYVKQSGPYELPFERDNQFISAGQRGCHELVGLNLEELPNENFSEFDAPSSNEDLSCIKSNRSLTNSVPLETARVFLFGSIASSTQLRTAGVAQVETFRDAEPFFKLLQGRRLSDIFMADHESDGFEDEFLHQTALKRKNC